MKRSSLKVSGIVSTILLVILLSSCLAGCGGGGSSSTGYYGGGDSGGSSVTKPPQPSISSISPITLKVGDQFTITGSSFGDKGSQSYVDVGGVAVINYSSWNINQIVCTVPPGLSAGRTYVTVHNENGASALTDASVVTITGSGSGQITPSITDAQPRTVRVGNSVTVTGLNFGSSQKSNGYVAFSGVKATQYTSWSDTQIVCLLPSGAPTGSVYVTVYTSSDTSATNPDIILTVVTDSSTTGGGGGAGVGTPQVTGVQPNTLTTGTEVKVTGTNFGGTRSVRAFGKRDGGYSSVGLRAPDGTIIKASKIVSWSSGQIVFVVPGLQEGVSYTVVIYYESGSSTYVSPTIPGADNTMNVTPPATPPVITNIAAGLNNPGTVVTINGKDFGASRAEGSYVSFNGIIADSYTSWIDGNIQCTIPSSVSPGNCAVCVHTTTGGNSNSITMTVNTPAGWPTITSITPSSAAQGQSVTINGSGFGGTRDAGASCVSFLSAISGNIYTSDGYTSWADDKVVCNVPSYLPPGIYYLSVSRVQGATVQSSAAVQFSVVAAPTSPEIVSVSMPLNCGQSFTINGRNFGATQARSKVFIGECELANFTSWSDTEIVCTVGSAIAPGSYFISVVTTGGTAITNHALPVTSTAGYPSVTSITPSTVNPGATFTITGTNLGTTQGTLTIGGTAATVTSWCNTSVVATVPALAAGTYNVAVTPNGAAASAYITLTVVGAAAPIVTSITPGTAVAGSNVAITGLNLGTTPGTVTVGGFPATVTVWSDTIVNATVPATLPNGYYTVAVTPNGGANTATITLYVCSTGSPAITSVTPSSASPGSLITFTGVNLGTSGLLTIGGSPVPTLVTGWSNTSVTATVPVELTAGTYTAVITPDGGSGTATTTVTIVALTSPCIVSATSSGNPGSTVTIVGSNFGTTQGAGYVSIGGYLATVAAWSATVITATVPAAIPAGSYSLAVSTAAGAVSPSTTFTVTSITSPAITSVAPSAANPGDSITITGSNFGATQSTGYVSIGGYLATVTTWSATVITATVPAAIPAGTYSLAVCSGTGAVSPSITLTVATPTSPAISSVTPSAASPGASITITGVNFGTTQGTGYVSIGGYTATVASWTATAITAVVPAAIPAGTYSLAVCTGAGAISPSITFTATSPASPVITTVAPNTGTTGTSVTITGLNLGTSGTVTFGGAAAAVTSWASTSIVVTVPAGLSGSVTIVVTPTGSPTFATSTFTVI